jgi:hypothetical protein
MAVPHWASFIASCAYCCRTHLCVRMISCLFLLLFPIFRLPLLFFLSFSLSVFLSVEMTSQHERTQPETKISVLIGWLLALRLISLQLCCPGLTQFSHEEGCSHFVFSGAQLNCPFFSRVPSSPAISGRRLTLGWASWVRSAYSGHSCTDDTCLYLLLQSLSKGWLLAYLLNTTVD